jgi:hypothetical protein
VGKAISRNGFELAAQMPIPQPESGHGHCLQQTNHQISVPQTGRRNFRRFLGSPDVLIVQADAAEEEQCKYAVEATVKHFRRRMTLLSFSLLS